MINLSKRQLLIVGIGVLVLAVVIILFFTNLRRLGITTGEKVSLVVAGQDPPSVWEGIIKSYEAFRPNVSVRYISVDRARYKEEILNALASGLGPDVFYIGNHDLLAESNKIAPISQAQFDPFRLRELFPTVVEQDFVLNNRVGALPLYLDTMAMIYNRDIFDQAGIAVVPKTWDEFLRILPQLRQFGAGGQITRAAAAIGGTEKSVDAGVDLLNLLMLQNGARMNNAENTASTFASGESGLLAFNFYLQFANAASPNFTWSDGEENSLISFAGGKVAVIFNYLSSLERVKNINAFLDTGVSPMLQASGAASDINYANYHGLAVSRQSRVQNWAWDFVVYTTTNPITAEMYANAAGRPPALRTLIGKKAGDPDLGVFAGAALTARSWVQPSGDRAREIFNGAIQDVLSGRTNSSNALKQAEGRINQLFPKQ